MNCSPVANGLRWSPVPPSLLTWMPIPTIMSFKFTAAEMYEALCPRGIE